MPKKRKDKFNRDMTKKAKKDRTINGQCFDSDMEFNYYKDVLLPLKEEGIIKEIRTQVEYELQPPYIKNGKKILPIKYVADFVVLYSDGHEEIVDIKGMVLENFSTKKKILEYIYKDITLIVLGYSKIDGGFVGLDVIAKGRKERKKAKALLPPKEKVVKKPRKKKASVK